jgi:glycerol-3-phosphate dehydrogenase
MMDLLSQLPPDSFSRFEKARWCGLRPLVVDDAGSSDTKSIARKHVIEEQQSGLISLMGGKWTIYRRMGQDLVDLIAKKE